MNKKSEQKPKREKSEGRKTTVKDSSLELGFSKKLIERIIIAVVLTILAFFFIKTWIWERNYYKEKEGSTRAVATNVNSDAVAVEVDETPVTEEQIREHIVPETDPRYLSIDKLGIKNARVLNVGLTKDGELATPYGIFDVGWYNLSGRPGRGGTMLIDGHNGGPNVVGVFKYLDKLDIDDKIVIERGDGEKFTYRVVENKTVPLDESDEYMKTAMTSPSPGQESLSLITCTGEWSQLRQTYLSRQFVRAVLTHDE